MKTSVLYSIGFPVIVFSPGVLAASLVAAATCEGPTILCDTPKSIKPIRRDQYGRPYKHPEVTLANCTHRYDINFKYIRENYGYAYKEKVGSKRPGYSYMRWSKDSLGTDAALDFSRGCEKICWQAPRRPPLGGGWTYIGQYGRNSECRDTYTKLISRRGSRVEVDFTTVNRLRKPKYPNTSYSRTKQIQCGQWNYWDGSSWAPITSNTRLDNAAKEFC